MTLQMDGERMGLGGEVRRDYADKGGLAVIRVGDGENGETGG